MDEEKTNKNYDAAKKFAGTTDKETLQNAIDFLKKIKKDKKNVDSDK